MFFRKTKLHYQRRLFNIIFICFQTLGHFLTFSRQIKTLWCCQCKYFQIWKNLPFPILSFPKGTQGAISSPSWGTREMQKFPPVFTYNSFSWKKPIHILVFCINQLVCYGRFKAFFVNISHGCLLLLHSSVFRLHTFSADVLVPG